MGADFDSRLCNQVDLLLDHNTATRAQVSQPSGEEHDGEEASKAGGAEEQASPAAYKKFKQTKKKKKGRRPQDYEDLEFRQLRSRTETPSKEEPKLPAWPFGKDQILARKNSPSKIIQKQRDRQEKAEMIRAQIVANRQ